MIRDAGLVDGGGGAPEDEGTGGAGVADGTGDAADRERLDRLGRLYEEIRAQANRLFDRERTGHTLQPTAVANEAWIRLIDRMPPSGEGPELALIARVVRNVLVDHARRRASARRGGDRRRMPIDPDELTVRDDPEAMIIVGDAIEALARRSPRAASVVELRFIAGCDEAEVALLLGHSRSTISRDWHAARLWLSRALREDGDEPGEPDASAPDAPGGAVP